MSCVAIKTMLNAQSHSHCPTALHARTSQQASSCRHLALPERPEAPAGLQPTCPRPQCSLSPAALARSIQQALPIEWPPHAPLTPGARVTTSITAWACLPLSGAAPITLHPSTAAGDAPRPCSPPRSAQRGRGLQLTAAAGARARRSRHGQRGPLGVAAMRQQTRGAVGSPAQARERRRDRGSSHMAWHRLGYFAHNKFLQNRKIKCFRRSQDVPTRLSHTYG